MTPLEQDKMPSAQHTISVVVQAGYITTRAVTTVTIRATLVMGEHTKEGAQLVIAVRVVDPPEEEGLNTTLIAEIARRNHHVRIFVVTSFPEQPCLDFAGSGLTVSLVVVERWPLNILAVGKQVMPP